VQNQFGYGGGQRLDFQGGLNGGLNGGGVERKVVDPATIVEWSAGLRCVMRTVAKHDQMIYEIRKVSSFFF